MAKAFVEGEILRHQAAMLRLVMALKRQPDKDPDDLIDRVAVDTGVDPLAFRAFLLQHDRVVAKALASAPEDHDPAKSRDEALTRAEALGLKLEARVRAVVRGAKKMRSPVA